MRRIAYLLLLFAFCLPSNVEADSVSNVYLYVIIGGDMVMESDIISLDGWQNWKEAEIENISLNGEDEVTVGVHVIGGGGGWVDLANPLNVNSRRTVVQQTSGTREYTVVGKPFDKQRQCLTERYYTVQNGAKIITNVASAFNRFQPHSKTFQTARLFFHTNGNAEISAAIGNQPAATTMFGPSGNVQMMETLNLPLLMSMSWV